MKPIRLTMQAFGSYGEKRRLTSQRAAISSSSAATRGRANPPFRCNDVRALRRSEHGWYQQRQKKNEKLDEMLSQFVDVQKTKPYASLILRHTSTGRKKRTLLGGHRGIHALPSGATRNCRMNVKRWNS